MCPLRDANFNNWFLLEPMERLMRFRKETGNTFRLYLGWTRLVCDGGKLRIDSLERLLSKTSKIKVGQNLSIPSLYHSLRRHPRGGLELTQVEELAKVINPVVLTQYS
ncbi:hypothetical protein Tco_1010661 [Tanacetum coccineum]